MKWRRLSCRIGKFSKPVKDGLKEGKSAVGNTDHGLHGVERLTSYPLLSPRCILPPHLLSKQAEGTFHLRE